MDWLLAPLKAFFDWVVAWLLEPSETLISTLENLFPAFGGELAAVNQFLGFVDNWIDVDLCIQMTEGFLAFWVALTAYKVIKSWIPTVSG